MSSAVRAVGELLVVGGDAGEVFACIVAEGCGFFEAGEDLGVGGDVGWGGDDGGGDVGGDVDGVVVVEVEAAAGELGDGRGPRDDADADVGSVGCLGDGAGLFGHDGG